MLSIWQKIMEKIVKSVKQQDDPRGKDAPSLPVLRAELQIPQTIIERYDAGQHKNDTREWWRLIIDGGTLVFAVLGFGVLYQTLNETRRATSAVIENARLDKRAWVGLGDIVILNKPTAGIPLEVKAVLKNSGESPAIHMFMYGHLFLLKSAAEDVRIPFTEHPDLLSCERPKPYWNDALGGAMFIPGSDSMSLNRVSEALPEAFLELAMRGKSMWPHDLSVIPTAPNTHPDTRSWKVGLFFVGCIDYFDVFRNAHRTSFCYSFSHDGTLNAVRSNGNLSNCVRGNDAD